MASALDPSGCLQRDCEAPETSPHTAILQWVGQSRAPEFAAGLLFSFRKLPRLGGQMEIGGSGSLGQLSVAFEATRREDSSRCHRDET